MSAPASRYCEDSAAVLMAVKKVVPILTIAIRGIVEGGGYGAISMSIEPVSGRQGRYRVIVTGGPSVLIKINAEEKQTQ